MCGGVAWHVQVQGTDHLLSPMCQVFIHTDHEACTLKLPGHPTKTQQDKEQQ